MSNFDPTSVSGLVGLWDFKSGDELADTGLDDGVAQNGWLHGGATISGDRAHFSVSDDDDHPDYFDVDGEIIGGSPGDSPNAGDDDPFDLASGTIEVQFTQDQHIGSSPDTLVNRGEYDDRNSEGYFSIAITKNGAIKVIHIDGSEQAVLQTSNGLVNSGDLVNVKYSWDETNGVQLEVENITTGASQTLSDGTTGLTMEVGDNDDESFTFGAREDDDATYDQFFDGSIDYVAIYEEATPPGPVDGLDSGELMNPGYTDLQGDQIDGTDGDDDTIFGNDGDDTINAGLGDDTVEGGEGDDVISGGVGNNLLSGGGGDDVFVGGDGADTFEGDADQDNLDYSDSDAAVQVNLTTGSLSGGDADNDSIAGGIDGVIGSEFGDELIGFNQQGTNPSDVFTNQFFGEGGDDTIEGRGGDDLIDGGDDNDQIDGGDGDDLMTGGDGDDVFTENAGDGADTIEDFNVGNSGPITDGDQTNNDFVDLSNFFNASTVADANAAGGSFGNAIGMLREDAADGTIDGVIGGVDYSGEIGDVDLTLEDGAGGAVTGTDLTFDNTNVVCFVRGTQIATRNGGVAIEDLTPGTEVITMDHGFQKVRWIGSTTAQAKGKLAPVVIRKGAMGNERDLRVSPQHRMLVRGWHVELMFGKTEALVPAKALINDETVFQLEGGEVEYFHVLFDQHELIYAEGIPSESFHPGHVGMGSFSEETREEILHLFPELREDVNNYAETVRPSLKVTEARVLAENPELLRE